MTSVFLLTHSLTYAEHHIRFFHKSHRKEPMCVKHEDDVKLLLFHRLEEEDEQHR